jgi:hypothetical protein
MVEPIVGLTAMEAVMSKYEPLNAFLKAQTRDEIPMTFSQIEEIVGSKLPPSKRNRAWWSNNPDNSVMTKAWLAAGYKTVAVDIPGEKLVFHRVRGPQAQESAVAHEGLRESTAPFVHPQRHPGFGFMKGLIKIEEGFDVTKQFDDEPWDKGYLGSNDRK